MNPTQARLKELFEYNPETGVMTRKVAVRGSGPVGSTVGCLNAPLGIMVARVDGKIYSVHRLVWCWVHGETPEGGVGHVGRDKTDNRISNLYEIRKYKWDKAMDCKTRDLMRFNFGPGVSDRKLR